MLIFTFSPKLFGKTEKDFVQVQPEFGIKIAFELSKRHKRPLAVKQEEKYPFSKGKNNNLSI